MMVPRNMPNPSDKIIEFEAASFIAQIGELLDEYAKNAAVEWAEQTHTSEPTIFMVDRCKEALMGKVRDYISDVQPYPYQMTIIHAEEYFRASAAASPDPVA